MLFCQRAKACLRAFFLDSVSDKKFSQRTVAALLPLMLLTGTASQAAAVGTLSGQFSVTPNGSASYSVPIKVPPGIGGMQPQLSLEYSSQSGNGLVGMGWSLGGMSAVTRCGKTLSQEGVVDGVDLTSDDKFCLDGAKLISTNGAYGATGTVYTTEVDSYSKIVQDEKGGGCTGPCGFTVYTKAGQIYEYGYDAKATQNIAGQPAALSWSVSKLKDTLDNTITYHWLENTTKGSHRIDRIVYTSNPNTNLTPLAEIKFQYYAQRPDPLEGYAMGAPVTTDVRLTKIIIRRGENDKPKVREYRLAYKTQGTGNLSLLGTLTECGFNQQGQASCLMPTVLDWNTPTKYYSEWEKVGGGRDFSLENCTFLQADVDIDGKTDLICAYAKSLGWSRSEVSNKTFVKSSRENYASWKVWDKSTVPSGSIDYYNGNYCKPVSADINGDGLTDLVCVIRFTSSSNKYRAKTWVQFSTGTKFLPWQEYYYHSGSSGSFCNAPSVGDVNGDGRHDLICIQSNGTSVQFAEDGTMSAWQTIGSVHSDLSKCHHVTTGDVNNDGLTDNICLYDTVAGGEATDVQLSLGDHYDSWRRSSSDYPNYDLGSCEAFHEGDFNGDGQTDMLCAYTGNQYFVQKSKGGYGTTVGFEDWEPWGTDTVLSQKSCRDGIKAVDVDIDGRTDLVCAYRTSTTETKTYVKLSTGSGFKPWEERHSGYNNQIADINSCHKVLAGDTNGDGHADLICIKSEGGVVNTYIQKHTQSAPSYLLDTLTDAFNNTTQIDYLPLTDASVYIKGTGNAYPAPDFQGPIYVVSKASASDGIGGMSGTTYHYEGARIDRTGRGFLGFRKVSSTSEATGIKSTTTYSQTFPTIGMPELAETWLANGTRIGRAVNKWYIARPGGTASGRYRILSTRTEEKNYELSGALTKTVITQNKNYDAYGYPKEVIVTTSGGGQTFTQTTISEFDNLTGPWHLGRLRRSAVTSTSPTNSQTRVSAFTYFATHGLLQTETIEPDNLAFTLTKTYSYDDYGNRKAETVRDSGSAQYKIAPATTRALYTYDNIASGNYTITTTNAKGHTETKTIDVRYGQPFSLKGPNALTTRWSYDHFGRQVEEIRADGTKTKVNYLSCDVGSAGCLGLEQYRLETLVLGKLGDLSTSMNAYYDGLARALRQESYSLKGDSIFIEKVYDSRGRIARQSRPYIENHTPFWTDYDFDDLDRPTFIYSPDGGILQTQYYGLKTTITKKVDASVPSHLRYWQRMHQTVNALGQEILVEDENKEPLEKNYDALGNLVWTKDPSNNTTTLEYDIRGNKTSMDDPDLGHWEYKYDALGQLRWQKNAKGQSTTLTYDTLGRMLTRKEPEGTTTWAYDTQSKGTGKLASITAPGGYFEQPTYDWLGRTKKTLTRQAGVQDLWVQQNFDSHGRALKTTYPSGYAVQNIYNAFGHLHKVKEVATNKILWEAQETDADGNVTLSQLGNTLSARIYDPASGRMKVISTGSQGNIQSLHYTFDSLGNLKERIDDNQNALKEKFGYDKLNHLTSAELVGFGTKAYQYDALGNILKKGNITDYRYEGTNNAGPHAVTWANGKRYGYDKNGNMTWGNGRSIQWTSYNKPKLISKGNTTLTFNYGPGRARYKQVKTITYANSTATTTTTYLGKLFEQSSSGGETKRKHFIYAGGALVSIHTTSNKAADKKRYNFTDHLGSTDVITNENSTVTGRLSFNAFGGHRGLNWRDSNVLAQLQLSAKETTSRGFTGHEQLDDVGLIHMNGRVYDPTLGRFISADPQVQFVSNLQSYNRYSYVHNNPLSYTDPSGFGIGSWLKNATGKFRDAVYKWSGAKATVNFIKDNQYAQMAIQIAAASTGTWWVMALTSSALTAVNGGRIGDIVKSGLIAGVTAGMFQGVGELVGNVGMFDPTKMLLHGLVGGASSAMMGGGFKAGFMAAGFTAGVAPGIQGSGFGKGGQMILASLAGGTASEIGGGKFANGAVTGAMSYAFNQMKQGQTKPQEELPIDEMKRLGNGMRESAQRQLDVVEPWLDERFGSPNYEKVLGVQYDLNRIREVGGLWAAGSSASDYGTISFSARPTSIGAIANFGRKLISPFVNIPQNRYVQNVGCNFSSGSCSASVINTRTGNTLYKYSR